MSDELGNFTKDTLEGLIHKMQRYGSDNDMRYRTLDAELSRRISVAQISAANAQIRVSWYQFAAVIAMFLTMFATVAAPFLMHLL